MLLGHWIEMRSVRHASRALDELAKLMPDTAERILCDGETDPIIVWAYVLCYNRLSVLVADVLRGPVSGG